MNLLAGALPFENLITNLQAPGPSRPGPNLTRCNDRWNGFGMRVGGQGFESTSVDWQHDQFATRADIRKGADSSLVHLAQVTTVLGSEG